MTTLTDEQEERAREILERYRNRVSMRESMFENGEVEQDLPSFYRGTATDYKHIGILLIYEREFADAISAFQEAADWYLESAQAYEDKLAVIGSLSLANGVYTASLAGDEDCLVQLGEAIEALHTNHNVHPNEDSSDRFYLAGCLGVALGETIPSNPIDSIQAINDQKSETETVYGDAIMQFSTGMVDANATQIRQGVNSMIEYHERTHSDDNSLELIMAPQATALLSLARLNGHDIEIQSEFVPIDFVSTVSDPATSH